LDIDLLGYAVGDLDAASTAELDQHLVLCLLCRIHLNRILRSEHDRGQDSVPTLIYPEISPAIVAVAGAENRPATFEPGQLWLVGAPRRMFVWVEAVNETAGMATVLAASLDVDAADHTSLIVDVPRLGREVAIFTSIPGWISLDRLTSFIDDVNVTDEIAQVQESTEQPIELTDIDNANRAGSTPVSRRKERSGQPRVGTRLSGSTDERLEFRQMLADQLAELDPEADDPDQPVDQDSDPSQFDAIVASMRNDLEHDLSTARHGLCRVNIDHEIMTMSHLSSLRVRPVATVHELDCMMLVVVRRASDEVFGFEPEDAYKLLLDSGASSLAVAEPMTPYLTRMFVRPVLRPAFELPRATERHDPRPLWESRPLTQAVFDYLQGDVFPIESEPVSLTPSVHPDLTEFFMAQSLLVFDELKQIRAQKGKNRALKALRREDAVALTDALAANPHLDALIRRIEEITAP
jgi:hypothetical protein